MLEDATLDPGSNGQTTTLTLNDATFVADPVCEGVANSLRSNTLSGFTSEQIGAVIANTTDINEGSDRFRRRCVFLWARCEGLNAPTCIYEQGAQVNNLAILTGLGGVITAQAADANEEFMIAGALQKTQELRNYFVAFVWEHNTQHAGSGNRIALFVNGIQSEVYEGAAATDVFPSHTGDITVGNTDDSLKIYNEGVLTFPARRKWVNMLGMINDSATFSVDTGDVILRDIFERSVIPEVTISADTVANQQLALDALDGTNYGDVNCAIRIIQATDATDYTLTVPDISFAENTALNNIGIQYVGPNTLTLQLTVDINPLVLSTPAEVETTVAVNPGGGSIVISPPPVGINFNVIFEGGALPADYEWRLYVDDPAPGVIGTVELAGAEAETSPTVSYNYTYTSATAVNLQIIADGYQEFLEQYALSPTSQTFSARIQFDPNL